MRRSAAPSLDSDRVGVSAVDHFPASRHVALVEELLGEGDSVDPAVAELGIKLGSGDPDAQVFRGFDDLAEVVLAEGGHGFVSLWCEEIIPIKLDNAIGKTKNVGISLRDQT